MGAAGSSGYRTHIGPQQKKGPGQPWTKMLYQKKDGKPTYLRALSVGLP